MRKTVASELQSVPEADVWPSFFAVLATPIGETARPILNTSSHHNKQKLQHYKLQEQYKSQIPTNIMSIKIIYIYIFSLHSTIF